MLRAAVLSPTVTIFIDPDKVVILTVLKNAHGTWGVHVCDANDRDLFVYNTATRREAIVAQRRVIRALNPRWWHAVWPVWL